MTRWIDAGRALLDVARAEDRGSGIRGFIGDAVFAYALGSVAPLEAHAFVQRALDDLEAHGTDPSLHRGIAGLGLVIASQRPEEDDLLGYVDETLVSHLETVPPASLQSGAGGMALYASLRSGAESGRSLQRAIVARLRATAVRSGDGVVWYTPADYARGRRVEVLGEPVLEYGAIHGVAGALVGLAALAAQGSSGAAELARAGLAAAWGHARGGASRFGRILFGEGGSRGALEFPQPRWCVGDPGVLRALWLAARTVGDAESAERAFRALHEDAELEARADVDRLEGRLDLCCGAAAVAQVYLRMHRETGERAFEGASAALLARCARGYDGLADTTFAYGRMGVLLALLAAEREDDPSWDAMLGMSLPCAALPAASPPGIPCP